MSRYGYEIDAIFNWVRERKAELSPAWADAVYDYVGGSPWCYYVSVLMDDALDAHVRAERWAHMQGEAAPSSHLALEDMLSRLRAIGPEGRSFDDALLSLQLSKDGAK